jgi:hypothetical protein
MSSKHEFKRFLIDDSYELSLKVEQLDNLLFETTMSLKNY